MDIGDGYPLFPLLGIHLVNLISTPNEIEYDVIEEDSHRDTTTINSKLTSQEFKLSYSHPFSEKSKLEIGYDFDPLVIAEIGINHGGSLKTAFEMVDAAISAGAEVIKHSNCIAFMKKRIH